MHHSIHQVVTGALNPGEDCFSVGNVEGLTFVACAVGTDVIVLANSLERVQVIPINSGDTEEVVNSISCCADTGKIAVCSGSSRIRIMEPALLGEGRAGAAKIFSYRWAESQVVEVDRKVDAVQWAMDGLRLLVLAGLDILLYQHRMLTSLVRGKQSQRSLVRFSLSEDESPWEVIWKCRLSAKVKCAKFSPDGTLLATCSEGDHLVKVWYQQRDSNKETFSFLYVQHPAPVCGFEWRQSGRYMPRRYVQNSLITWCEDNVSRIWKEIPNRESGAPQSPTEALLDAVDVVLAHQDKQHQVLHQHQQHLHQQQSQGAGTQQPAAAAEERKPSTRKSKKGFSSQKSLKKARSRLVNRLGNLMKDEARKRPAPPPPPTSSTSGGDHPAPLSPNIASTSSAVMARSSTLADFASPSISSSASLVLAATIGAENDCLLVPAMSPLARSKRPFAVHWINNKEMTFTNGAERLLAEQLTNDQTDSVSRVGTLQRSERGGVSPNPTSSSNSMDALDTVGANSPIMAQSPVGDEPAPSVTASEGAASSSTRDLLDMKLEGLLRQWNKSYDVLFCIHPVDGSLLTWTLDYLDDPWKQAQVSFASRSPDAFPLTDANSLNLPLRTYNPYDPVYAEVMSRRAVGALEEVCEKSPSADSLNTIRERFSPSSRLNTVLLLTSHENGSLNLWRLSMDDTKQFTTILNIVHQRRMCGHRFHISQVVAHPVLPLLLTASHFAADSAPPLSTTHIHRSSSNETEEKESELVLWKVAPVGPLKKSGGVRELARIRSLSPNAFTCLAWVPAILPSSLMGSACHSPSSCFIGSNNGRLTIYQAIVDARGLLSQLYQFDPSAQWSRAVSRDSSTNSLNELASPLSGTGGDARQQPSFCNIRVVSTQSTARPGCIVHVADIDGSEHHASDILLLHVFDESLALANDDSSPPQSDESTASRHYLIVMVVRCEGCERLKMWRLEINISAPVPLLTQARSPSREENSHHHQMFYPHAQPDGDQLVQLGRLQSSSLKIYDEPILSRTEVEQGVRVVSCVAAAGHLPSSSLYPACKAPYSLVVSCSDDKVCFLKCTVASNDGGTLYRWDKWRMLLCDGVDDSSLEMDGEIYACSSAHSGRFACAFRAVGATSHSGTAIGENLELAVFECESSGGVEWLREDTFNLEKCFVQPSSFLPSIQLDTNSSAPLAAQPLLGERAQVRIDWVSTEDGAYILTVGIGPLISLFAQVSQDTAQQNVVMMKEHEGIAGKRAPLRKSSSLVSTAHASSRLIRWMCIRTLELHSADGLPPLPTAMSWVRDGLLIVGMKSEMRVYSQWNLASSVVPLQLSKLTHHHPGTSKSQAALLRTPLSTLNISRSHSILDQLSEGGGLKKHLEGVHGGKMLRELMSRALSSPKLLVGGSEAWPGVMGSDESILRAISEEGLFEASRLASPILPQYHPKQLIEMLNAGKTKRVKAVLLHVLRTLKQMQKSCTAQGHVGLARVASMKKSFGQQADAEDAGGGQIGSATSQRRQSVVAMVALEEESAEYLEVDFISPLPLYALFAADTATDNYGGTASGNAAATALDTSNPHSQYDTLFNMDESEEDLDEMLMDDDEEADGDALPRRRKATRSRHSSGTSAAAMVDAAHNVHNSVTVNFTSRHRHLLTNLLTHTHLPGLSSVDQMHLLAIAETITHFSPSVMDKLAQANASLRPALVSTLGDSAAAGYATASMGVETVDECGLRFLMAMKQHEYLCLCLPLKPRQALKAKGLASSHVIWAFHSDTETELLSSIPCFQKSQETWEELRAYGIGWWLKNTSTLRICAERMAKYAFQQNQDPMDSSLFYLALRKKNVIMHLFKTVSNTRLHDFFREDFNDDKWKKAAFKNAFALMGKQRFHHAAAFFLLGGSLEDALKTIIGKLDDLQLAMVILRLYETDQERQSAMMANLLREEVLGQCSSRHKPASRDPFERSMAYWLIKDYVQSASTLVEEASRDSILHGGDFTERSLSDIFNFYSFLRRHPLVVRQRLTQAGIQTVSTTEQFLAHAKEMESHVTRSERRLYFRTASAHLASGCPLLALDVLSRLPNRAVLAGDDQSAGPNYDRHGDGVSAVTDEGPPIDWSAPEDQKDAELKLDWDDDSDAADVGRDDGVGVATPTIQIHPADDRHGRAAVVHCSDVTAPDKSSQVQSAAPPPVDFISQHLKFICTLRIMVDELATLASGFEVNGGQLRYELFKWLERECEVLRATCDYRAEVVVCEKEHEEDVDGPNVQTAADRDSKPLPLHEALRLDRLEMRQRVSGVQRRRHWLAGHQKLIRTLTSYCALHSSQNHRLASVQMELLLLLLEVQRGASSIHTVTEPVPDMHSFPLLVASISSGRMFVSSPLHFLQNQCADLLLSIAEMKEPPNMDTSLAEVYSLYNLCHGLSSCVYQSLSSIETLDSGGDGAGGSPSHQGGALTGRVRLISTTADDSETVRTVPTQWPGVKGLISLLARERDEDTPNLRLLIAEFFVATTMSLFAYAFAIYDARWIYRLCAHQVDGQAYGTLFGGGGQRRLRGAVPCRPPPPTSLSRSPNASAGGSGGGDGGAEDPAIIRARLHAKVGIPPPGEKSPQASVGGHSTQHPASGGGSEAAVLSCWIPPRKHMVQFYAEKVESNVNIFGDYDSDKDVDENDNDDDDDDGGADDGYSGLGDTTDPFDVDAAHVGNAIREARPHDNPNSYAWMLLRLASVIHIQRRIHTFLQLAGFDLQDVPTLSPRLDNLLKTLASWERHLRDALDRHPDGCPDGFLRSTAVEQDSATAQSASLLRKYRSMIEPNNTPFEYAATGVKAVRRLWSYLVLQEHLSQHFIRYIFGKSPAAAESRREKSSATTASSAGGGGAGECIKIIQREHEPIVAFACNFSTASRPGCVVVSTGRELQELSLEKVLDEQREQHIISQQLPFDASAAAKQSTNSYMNNRVELDIQLQQLQRDTIRDNDDYQLITDGSKAQGKNMHGSAYIRKRPIAGIRRLESHPSLPYYVSGSSDGSILLWEWGVEQPLFTARVAGQYAKVNKLAFAQHGNKFAAVDGDGLLCIWQASQGIPVKKPFFSQRCHSKSAVDVKFLGQSASLLATAGHTTGDQNIAVWDTLMPQSKSLIHSFVGHSEGATALLYVSTAQTLLSGGKHGEVMIWDLRQRQLRSVLKVFDSNVAVRAMCVDANCDVLAVGSSDGDIRVYSVVEPAPQPLLHLPGEHASKGGFSLRQVGSSSIQGVQQLSFDNNLRLFSCGADNSMKFRVLPSSMLI